MLAGNAARLDPKFLESLTIHGIKANRILPGNNGQIAVIGRSMGDLTKRTEAGVVDYARFLRDSKYYQTELFAGDRLSAEAKNQIESLLKAESRRQGREVTRLSEDVIKTTLAYKENVEWANRMKREGYTVIDIGNPNGLTERSAFYDAECMAIFGSITP